MLHHADHQAADDVDEHDDDAGDGIAAHELGGTVHRAVEVGFLRDLGAAFARHVFADQAGIQVGIDGHLLARHRIQGETRAHFGDTSGTLGDDHEVDDHQDDEHHDTHGVVAADQEVAERFDHLARRVRAGVALQQHHARGSDVERQAQQGGDQQHRGEHGEVERLGGVHRHQQHHDGQRDVEGEQDVEQERRQRQHHHRQDHHDQDGACQAAHAAAQHRGLQDFQHVHTHLLSSFLRSAQTASLVRII